jgi:hypothetical protein
MSTNSRRCALTDTYSQKLAISVFIASMYLSADLSVFFCQAVAANAAAHQVPPRVRALRGGGLGGGRGGVLFVYEMCVVHKYTYVGVCVSSVRGTKQDSYACVCMRCAWFTNTHEYRYV